MNPLFDRRIAILGAGESGLGAALLAKAKGLVPFVSDNGKIRPELKNQLLSKGIAVEEGQHTESMILSADEVIVSPGIPDNAPIMLKLKEKDIPVISEIEFASRYTDARIIAITGTNGKTTTTYLIYHLMREAGLKVCMAGNVGNSFAREVLNNGHRYYVLEISSFQLDHMYDFKADISVLLNITPDHLDRYDHNMDLYTASKFRILQNQEAGDRFIYFNDDPVIKNSLEHMNVIPAMTPVSLQEKDSVSAYPVNGRLHFKCIYETGEPLELSSEELPLKGPHNQINLMCAIYAAYYAGVEVRQIRSGLSNFVNFPHRMENVGLINGVTWVNDSKATNVDSTRYALDSYNNPIIWIAGGIDKGNNYESIQNLVHRKVKAIVCMGKDNSKIISSFRNEVEQIVDTDNLKKAVHEAQKLADPGDVVLLSPACASFDLFRNYIDRGDQFREAVKELNVKSENKI